MKHEALEAETQYLTDAHEELPYDKDTLEDVYDNPEEYLENDEIADWEEGVLIGQENAYA